MNQKKQIKKEKFFLLKVEENNLEKIEKLKLFLIPKKEVQKEKEI